MKMVKMSLVAAAAFIGVVAAASTSHAARFANPIYGVLSTDGTYIYLYDNTDLTNKVLGTDYKCGSTTTKACDIQTAATNVQNPSVGMYRVPLSATYSVVRTGTFSAITF